MLWVAKVSSNHFYLDEVLQIYLNNKHYKKIFIPPNSKFLSRKYSEVLVKTKVWLHIGKPSRFQIKT